MRKFHQITLYTVTDSHPCELTREYFREQSMDFEEINVGKDKAAADEIFQKAETKELPIIEIDGRIVSGYRPDIFEILLADPGKNAAPIADDDE